MKQDPPKMNKDMLDKKAEALRANLKRRKASQQPSDKTAPKKEAE